MKVMCPVLKNRPAMKMGLIFLLWVLWFQDALAWGPTGHRIVAHIAEIQLQPETLAHLRAEFNIKHLADVANWADRIKKDKPAERPYHYVNIEKGVPKYDRSRDCPSGVCVTEKIMEFQSILASPHSAPWERRRAFRYLVHLIADVHQPMHVGNAEDRGGNEIRIRHRGEPSNLHALWDHHLISLKGQSEVRFARQMIRALSQPEMESWVGSNPVDWTNESRALVLDHGYPVSFSSGSELSADYLERGRKIVNDQMKRAGIRLAHTLNRLFR